MIVALLNRWASLQHVAPGLARLCGWLPAERRPVVDQSSLTYIGKAWDDLATQVLEWKDAEPILAASELHRGLPVLPPDASFEEVSTCAIAYGGFVMEVPDVE